MTSRQKQKQLESLGIAAESYQGLVVVEIEGPPVVALTPAEARQFFRFLKRAYREAVRDRDALVGPHEAPRSAQDASALDELVPDGTYGGARRVRVTAAAGEGE